MTTLDRILRHCLPPTNEELNELASEMFESDFINNLTQEQVQTIRVAILDLIRYRLKDELEKDYWNKNLRNFY